MKQSLTMIDLFAGCGGLSEGFKQTGKYKTVAGVEWEEKPCKTLVNRLKTKWNYKNADEIVLHFDIQRTNELINGWKNDPQFGTHKGIKSLLKNEKKVDLVIGGPPCQAYSVAGRIRDENGMNDDYRNFLFESYLNVVKEFQPKVFVFENVPGILSAQPGGISIVERITKNFKKAGYIITSDLRNNALINCPEFGVPQSRKRMVILGVKASEIKKNPQDALTDFYQNILPSYKAKKIVTVEDAIKDLTKLVPSKKIKKENGKKLSHTLPENRFLNHIPRFHSERDIDVFKMLTLDIKTKKFKYASSQALIELYYEKTGKRTNVHKYHVLRWDKPSNTIPAHLYKDGLRHIHPDPEQARTITVREAARLQSFDDDFEFLGSMGDQFKMIGNAVPPKFAKAVGNAVNDFINKYL
ncbi:MAG: DNA cytosine methyltransferase [Bacteroidota bacterium]|nr:DNA cytosine methyltransferase [Bacteroidota bacterium]MDP3558380.1 DNA cytosine methyltransferase [Bacteroidota bacterium]